MKFKAAMLEVLIVKTDTQSVDSGDYCKEFTGSFGDKSCKYDIWEYLAVSPHHLL